MVKYVVNIYQDWPDYYILTAKDIRIALNQYLEEEFEVDIEEVSRDLP